MVAAEGKKSDGTGKVGGREGWVRAELFHCAMVECMKSCNHLGLLAVSLGGCSAGGDEMRS